MAKASLTINIWTKGRQHLPKDNCDLPDEVFAPHVEHVARLCAQGYMSGQIVDERFEGWWTIERE